jgi:hypothetical protein
MTRSLAAMAALRDTVAAHRASLDGDGDVVAVTLTLKFVRGASEVRGVVYQEERLCRPATAAAVVPLGISEHAEVLRRG